MTSYVTVLSLPVSYRAYPSDPAAHLTAGVEITVGVTTSVKDEGIRRLLPEEARDNIVQVRYQSTGCKDTHIHVSWLQSLKESYEKRCYL